MDPWVCPKCHRVWGPLVSQCTPCNNAISRSGTNPYPTRDTNVAPPARRV